MRPRNAALLIDLFTGAVILSVAVALANVTWRLIELVDHRMPEPNGAPLRSAPALAIDITPILAFAPFGTENGSDLRPTSLPIELRGVFQAIPSEASTALIAPTGGASAAYKVGEAVPAGGSILAINRDSVVFAVNGHRELLGFPQPAGAKGAAPTAGPSAPGTSVTAQAPSPAGTAVSSAAPSTNPSQALLDSLGASPVSGGYRVGESLSSVAREAGLLPGDVINQVNGTLLGNPAMDRQTLALAARSGQLRIGLVRNGRQATFALPLQ